MNVFRRNQLLSMLFVLIIVLALVWLWRLFPITDSIVRAWNQPDVRNSTILPALATVSASAIVGTFLLFRNAVSGWFKMLWGGGLTEAQRKRWEGEKTYLEGLVNDFKDNVLPDDPWYVNGFIDLEALQKNGVQQARIIHPHLWRLSGSEEVGIEGHLGARINLQSFLRQEKKPIMIKGDPGTGKTLVLRHFAVDEAIKARNGMPGVLKLPVYIPLRNYVGRTKDGDPEPVFDFIQRCLAETPYATIISENLNDYLMGGRLLLLFDGLNELPPDEYLKRSQALEKFIFSSYFKNKAIFTCRTPRYTPEAKFTTIEISDLDNEQIKRFIGAYLTEKREKDTVEKIYHDLTTGDGFMLRICRNPFMLRMLVLGFKKRLIAQGAASTPETPSQLFENYVQATLVSASQNGKQIADALCDMAFAMQKGGQFAGAVDYDFLKTQLPGVPLDNYLQVAHQQALLNYTYDKEKGTHDIRFYHQILQEYFAATALKEKWEEGQPMDQYFSDYRWEDTILVCAGLTKDPEKFIREIWSSERDEPERFWLATKAVGISGVSRVSQPYYQAILEEAQENLDPDAISGSEGHFRTVLAVNTVKALSYLDNERAAVVLSETLSKSKGWVREVSIQALGNSRLKCAQDLLRREMINLRSLRALLLVAPYFSRTEWLMMVASSTITYDGLTSAFWWVLQLLWLLAPGVYIGLLLIGSRFFNVDPYVLMARVIALSIFLPILVSNLREVISIVRNQQGLLTKLKSLRDRLLWDIAFIVGFIVFWFFALEILYFITIILFILFDGFAIAICVTILIHFFDFPRLGDILYSWASKAAMTLVAILIAKYMSIFFLPIVWRVPTSFHTDSSLVMSALNFVAALLLDSFFGDGIRWLMAGVGIASTFVHLITYIQYWRFHRYYAAFNRKGKEKAAQYLVQIAQNRRRWFHLRKKAIEYLRLMDLPLHYIADLNASLQHEALAQAAYEKTWRARLASFAGGNLDLCPELERAIYELVERVREEKREIPDEKYLAMLVNRGKTSYQMGSYQEAFTYLNHAITLHGKNATAFSLRGKVRWHLEQYAEALTDLDQALNLDPKDRESWTLHGKVRWHLGQYAEALTDLDQALNLDSKDGESWILRAMVRWHLGQCAEALIDLKQALELNPRNDWALALQGIMRMRQGGYAEALEDLKRAIDLHPHSIWHYMRSNSWYYYNRALVYLCLGQESQFTEDMHSAIRLEQDESRTEQDKWGIDLSLALYKLVIGESADAQTRYGQVLTMCSVVPKLQEGADNLSNFLSLQPDHQLARHIYGQLQTRIADLKGALAV